MLYLILAIIGGSLFSIIFKLCQRHGVDGRQVTLFNYALAFLFTLLPIIVHVAVDRETDASHYLPGASSWLRPCLLRTGRSVSAVSCPSAAFCVPGRR